MFVDDETVTENQIMSPAQILGKRYCKDSDFKRKKRIDGRGLADVRQIKCEVGVLLENSWFNSF